MPENNATIGLGFTVAVNDGSGSTGSASALLIDLVDVNPPDPTVGTVESKRLNLTSRTIRKLPGLKDPGEFTFTYEYSKGKKARLDALVGSERVFVFVAPDAGDGAETVTVPAFVSHNMKNAVTPDGLMTCTCTCVVTGPAS